ncbi:MAG: class I SAM-dependent methyltransferase [Desulfobacterales bacterium]|nr:class I SAM-dependent methyltransferase [Desulfobacterales bacterium]
MALLGNQFGYWDRVAREKVFTHPLNEKVLTQLIDRKARLLDYGCGYGRTCDDLVRLGYADVTGVDTSAKMIQRGNRLFPHLNLKTLDLPDDGMLPFESEAFDGVLLFAVLTCIPEDGDQRCLIDEIRRILRPAGLLYVSDYWLQTDDRNVRRYRQFTERFGRYGIFELPEGTVVRHHRREHVTTLLRRFEILDLVDMEVVTMNGNCSNGFQYFGRKAS